MTGKFTLKPFDQFKPSPRRWDESRWNGWRLEGIELVYPAYIGGVYPIDLERCDRSSEVLDWIAQIAGKDWATDECLAGLIHALDDILPPLQRLPCRIGNSRQRRSGSARDYRSDHRGSRASASARPQARTRKAPFATPLNLRRGGPGCGAPPSRSATSW